MPKTRVLVVEDEWVVADALRHRLEDLNYEVPAVISTGEEAVEKVKQVKPDVVLMDIKLQGKMDGIEATKQIHAHSSVPVIYLTAFADESVLKRAKVTEPFGYIVKPVKDIELRSNIEIALYKQEAEQMLKRQKGELETLYNASLAISSHFSLDAVLKIVAEQITRALGCTGCGLYLWDPRDDIIETLLDYSLTQREKCDPPGTVYDLKEYPARRRVLKSGKPIVIHGNAKNVNKAELLLLVNRGVGHVLLPLVARDRTLGLLTLMSAGDPREFSKEQFRLADSLATHAAVAIDNACLYVEANKEIEEHKKTEKKLRRSEKKFRKLSKQLGDANNLKDILLDVITHDLRNPIGVISGMATLLREDQSDDERTEAIKLSANTLVKVLDETTGIASAILGDKIPKERLDIAPLVRDVVTELKVPLENAGMDVHVKLGPGLIAQANPIVRRIFRNFISNAIRYASKGKRIEIVGRKDSRMVTAGIKDFGRTIPESDYARIFERKVRLDPRIKKGGGLGLAIAKRIAKAHGGDIWVEPNYPKGRSSKPKGNIFYLKLPVR